MKNLEETRGTKFELARHFLACMFESEIFAVRGQWQNVALSAIAAILPVGLLFGNYAAKYRWLASLPSPAPFRNAAVADELSILALAMAVSGLVALFQWHSLYPSKRDYLSLAGLPIRSREIFFSRFAAVAVFTTAYVVVLNLFPSIIIPLQIAGRWQNNPSLLANIVAQAIAAGLACYFVFLAAMALQGALLHLLRPRVFARISASMQAIGIALCFFAALFSWTIGDWEASAVGKMRQFGGWAPPVWFLGLHETLLGDRDPFFVAMARRSFTAFGVALAVTALAYISGSRRYRKLLVENPFDIPVSRRVQWSLFHWIAGDPRREAIMQFMARTLARSRAHRTVLLAYIGAALGFVVNSLLLTRSGSHIRQDWYGAIQFVVLFAPIAIPAIVLPGFRHVCRLPAELPANWIFQTTESLWRKHWMSALERFTVACVIAPIYLVITPVAVSVLGWGLALRMTALQMLISLTIFEILFDSWQQLPFACSYMPCMRPMMATLARAVAVLGVLIPLLALMVSALSRLAGRFAVGFPLILIIWIWTRHRRRDGWSDVKLAYEDRPSLVANIGLGELTYHRDMVQFGKSAAALPHPSSTQPPAPAAPVCRTLRLYRALARAFPYEFKCAYEDELLQVTEEAIEPIWRRHGIIGLVRLLADITLRVPAEHASQFWRELRYSARALASSPGFTLVAVVSLTLAITIATCSFSVMNGMVLRVLPHAQQPDELAGFQAAVSYPDYQRYRELNDLFSSTMGYVAPVPFGISLEGRSQRVWGQLVTPTYFSTLGVRPLLGRAFGPQDDRPGAPATVVVSYRFWQGQLGGDPDVIGRQVRLNGHAVTIAGVGPKDFFGASPALFAADIWMPLFAGEQIAPELADHALARADRKMIHVVGRLRAGMTFDSAEARLDSVARVIERESGKVVDRDQSRHIMLVTAGKMLPMRKQDLPFFTSFFLILAALVVLIACANVATMMLARAARRRREIAIRIGLGAGRGRIMLQLLSESMIIAAAAGIVGLAFSTWVMHALSHAQMIPLPIPIHYDFSVDGRVFAFTLAITALTGLFFGLAPAWHATRVSVAPALKEGGNIQLRRFRRASLRNLLIVAQVAASLTLLVVVGMMALGIQSTVGVQQGFDPANVYLLAVDPVRDGVPPPQAQAFFPKLLDRVRALPGVSAACLTDTLPVAMNVTPWVRFSVAGAGSSNARVHGWAAKQLVGSGYFETLGVRMLQGRAFERRDEANASSTVIVSETFARQFWKGINPVGQQLVIESGENLGAGAGWPGDPDYRRGVLGDGPRTFEIIGVAADVTNSVIARNEHPAIYLPLRPADYGQPSLQGTTLIVRALPGIDVLRAMENQISAMDARIAPFNARTMPDHIGDFVMPLRAASWTYGMIGIFGLVLAAVGLAGVTAYSVSQRSHEIGVRVALGARASNVLGLVMREGAILILIGTAIGFAGAFGASRAMAAMNSSVGTVTSTSTSNPILLFGAPALLAALAMLACYVPARRSLRLDPLVALRQE